MKKKSTEAPKAAVPESLSREELVALVRRQQEMIERLREEKERLEKALAEATRAGSRSATPFSKPGRVEKPKKPGRRPGQGRFNRRDEPSVGTVTEQLEAMLPERCECGGQWERLDPEVASTTELPAAPQPAVTVFRVHIGRCRRCGRKARGRHPRLPADQHGATAHRLGPRALATAHYLHYGAGLTVRKTPAVLAALTGLHVTAGALTQDAQRRTRREAGRAYQELRRSMSSGHVTYTDDTGWKIGGRAAQLMGFSNARTTVYQVREQHRNEEVREVLPASYQGTMVTDRGKSYDAKELEQVKQQKCLAHANRSVKKVLETKRGRARGFGVTLLDLLGGVLNLWHDFWEGRVRTPTFERRRTKLEAQLTRHLRRRKLTDSDNQRLLRELGRHHRRGNLTRCLYDVLVQPTNNQAERELRPAVIARKVSHCSKTAAGAEAHACLASVCRTLQRRDPANVIENLTRLFRNEAETTPL